VGAEHYLQEGLSQPMLYALSLKIMNHCVPFGVLGAEVLRKKGGAIISVGPQPDIIDTNLLFVVDEIINAHPNDFT
jgi:hypothetical protein